MPHATYTADGGHFRVGGHGFDPGETRDVSDDLAGYLADLEEFEVEGADDTDADESTDSGAEDEPATDGFDVDAFLDRTPVGDVADDIRAGEADEHIDAVDEAADRTTVRDAIGERRAELEG